MTRGNYLPGKLWRPLQAQGSTGKRRWHPVSPEHIQYSRRAALDDIAIVALVGKISDLTFQRDAQFIDWLRT